MVCMGGGIGKSRVLSGGKLEVLINAAIRQFVDEDNYAGHCNGHEPIGIFLQMLGINFIDIILL